MISRRNSPAAGKMSGASETIIDLFAALGIVAAVSAIFAGWLLVCKWSSRHISPENFLSMLLLAGALGPVWLIFLFLRARRQRARRKR